MTKEEFILIAEKVGDGTATSSELAQYNAYFNEYHHLHDVWIKKSSQEHEAIGNELNRRISAQISEKSSTPTRWLWPRFVAAAIVLVVVSFSIYFYKYAVPSTETVVAQNHELAPGKNKAYLILSNGKRINLDDNKNLELTAQPGVTISKTAEGQLVYNVGEQAGDNLGQNTIETPKGGQFQIRLPDGTNVWLNAASSITYPVKFSGKKRMIELNGEAYFEVAHNAVMPFVVKTREQEIEVLGTHFNVMAYGNEPEVQTTLVQGAVRITTAQNTLLLKPGQQAKTIKNRVSYDPEADIASAIAWKSGKIQFSDMDIQHIMRMLARWYDFDVEYETKQLNITFGGSFSRNKNLSTILKSLASTGDVNFKVEGRRVVVMP